MSKLFETLLVLLVTAKLFAVEPVADWSWFWILSPFWAPVIAEFIGTFIRMFSITFRATWRTIKAMTRKPKGE